MSVLQNWNTFQPIDMLLAGAVMEFTQINLVMSRK